MLSPAQIRQNLDSIHGQIEETARRAGRKPADITVVAISKGHFSEAVRAAYECGQRVFGENRVEEALPKIEEVGRLPGIEWHMVGHIQSRKARDISPSFSMVHSIDRLKIAKRLHQFAAAQDLVLPVCLECNMSGEVSKYGWELTNRSSWDGVIPEFMEIFGMESLQVKGLMTMAPWNVDLGLIRGAFCRLRELRDYLEARLEVELPELSMGMSDDFRIAIEEGSTMVRIGTAIFGSRSK